MANATCDAGPDTVNVDEMAVVSVGANVDVAFSLKAPSVPSVILQFGNVADPLEAVAVVAQPPSVPVPEVIAMVIEAL